MFDDKKSVLFVGIGQHQGDAGGVIAHGNIVLPDVRAANLPKLLHHRFQRRLADFFDQVRSPAKVQQHDAGRRVLLQSAADLRQQHVKI